MGLLVTILAATLAASASRQPEVSNVRFVTSHLSVSRVKNSERASVGGAIRIDLSFRRPHVHKPVLRIFCLCEESGQLVCHRGLWDQPKTNRQMDRGEVTRLLKDVGYVSPPDRRETDLSDPALISTLTSSVTRNGYSSITYGDSLSDRGLFELKRSADIPRLLLYRLELWQNGSVVASHESSRTGLGRLAIPNDWTEWKKYPRLFRYEDR